MRSQAEIDDPGYWRGLAKRTRSLVFGAHPDATATLLEIADSCDELGRRAEERARRARKH
jgi:hypothetical protein